MAIAPEINCNILIYIIIYLIAKNRWRYVRPTDLQPKGTDSLRNMSLNQPLPRSVYTTRRPRIDGTKLATVAIVFKLRFEAQKTWRKIIGCKWIPHVMQGIPFIDRGVVESQEEVA